MPELTRNLLVRLINHRVTDDLARHEDYLTECLGWLLTNDHDLLADLLRPGGPVFDISSAPVEVTSLKVETQRDLGDVGRPDMRIFDDKTGLTLLVECKVGAPFDPEQILRYLSHVVGTERGFVVAIVPQRARPLDTTGLVSPHFLGVVNWEDIAKLLRRSVPDEIRQFMRQALLALLESYGLAGFRQEILEWEDPGGGQRVDEVRRICGVLDHVISEVAADTGLAMNAPRLYRPDGRRWELVLSPGSPIRSGTGPSPRPILLHQAMLRTPFSFFGSLMLTVSLRTYKRPGVPAEPTMSVSYCTMQVLGRHYPDQGEFLAELIHAGGGLVREDLPDLRDRAQGLLRAHRGRVRILMERVARRLAESGRIRGLLPLQVGDDDWGASLDLVTTRELMGSPVDTAIVAARYKAILEEVLTSFFASDPDEPIVRLVSEALMPKSFG